MESKNSGTIELHLPLIVSGIKLVSYHTDINYPQWKLPSINYNYKPTFFTPPTLFHNPKEFRIHSIITTNEIS